jgi:tRNA A-37 threonylcarbamoyl transferase component Bud32
MTSINALPANVAELRNVLIAVGHIDASARLTLLAGGVSSLVAVVENANEQWVVKTPLKRLAVVDEWIVDRSRGANEAIILDFLDGRLGPARIPCLRFFDATWTILGEELVAGPSPTYKDELLAGRSHPEVAASLGAAASQLHRLDPPDTLSGDGPRELFDALRLDAYYRATAERLAAHRDSLLGLVDETLAASPRSIVHGDLTPKNILVTGDKPVMLDWEVVHVGDPAFDLGTVTAHLMLKAVRGCPIGEAELIVEAARRFWATYEGPADRPRAFRHTGAVMLARLYGKSPVEYLTDGAARRRAHEIGVRALGGGIEEFEDLAEVARAILDGAVC